MDIERALEKLFDDPLLSDITAKEVELFHLPEDMRKVIHKKQADYVAQPKPCEDFSRYADGFKQIHSELRAGKRNLVRIAKTANLKEGHYYVVSGQLVLLEKILEHYEGSNHVMDGRTRCIYENGQESDILLQTLRKNVVSDGYGVTEPESEIESQFFTAQDRGEADIVTGYIYVLRSCSEVPEIARQNDLYKIGFTTNSVEERIANASNDPTYLMAPVEIVASYKVVNMHSQKFEEIIHKVLKQVQFHVKVVDDKGTAHQPCEWFVVPFAIVEHIIERIVDGSIIHYVYNPELQCLEKQEEKKSLTYDTQGMKVLTLRIKQIYFDEIVSGKKTVEYREIKQTTLNRYTYVDPADGKRYLRRFDALRLIVGYRQEGDQALVRVVDTQFKEGMVEYHLGEILEIVNA
ncbi:MAG: GIY-YIG nuclease family protein [Parabacteroides sp.]